MNPDINSLEYWYFSKTMLRIKIVHVHQLLNKLLLMLFAKESRHALHHVAKIVNALCHSRHMIVCCSTKKANAQHHGYIDEKHVFLT